MLVFLLWLLTILVGIAFIGLFIRLILRFTDMLLRGRIISAIVLLVLAIALYFLIDALF
ncbi:MAG: hypothetical protein ACOX3W_05405 [Christensenellaceae bacterium]|jgi:hypothetical protein